MLGMLLRHLRGNLVAYVALLFALTSTSYAAATKLLPANSVGTNQVINGSLERVDLNKKTIARLRGHEGERGPMGLRGPSGPTGAQGIAGAPGAKGPPGPVTIKYSETRAGPLLPVVQTQVAQCPPGMVVTGGGATTDPGGDPNADIIESDWGNSTIGGPPDLWFATLDNRSGAAAAFYVDAICTQPTSISAPVASAKSAAAHHPVHN